MGLETWSYKFWCGHSHHEPTLIVSSEAVRFICGILQPAGQLPLSMYNANDDP
jgi:hypothetical protein